MESENMLLEESRSWNKRVMDEEKRPFLEPSTQEVKGNVKTPNDMEDFNKKNTLVSGTDTLHPTFKEKEEKGEEEGGICEDPTHNGYFACDVKFSPIRDNLIAVAYSTPSITCVDSSVPGFSLLSKGVAYVDTVHHPSQSQPHQMLLCEATATCCCFSPQKTYLVFAGKLDRSQVLWDLHEPEFMHKSPLAGCPSLVLSTFVTACLSTPDMNDSSLLSFQLATLDQSGELNSHLATTLVAADKDYEDEKKKQQHALEQSTSRVNMEEIAMAVCAINQAVETRQANMVSSGQEVEPKHDDLLESAGLSIRNNHSNPICVICHLTVVTRDPSQTSAIEDDSSNLLFQLATLDQSGGLNSHLAKTPVASDKVKTLNEAEVFSNKSELVLNVEPLEEQNIIMIFIILWTCFYLLLHRVKAPNENKAKGFPHRATVSRCMWQYHFSVHSKELDTATWIFILLYLSHPGMAMMSPTEDIIAFENSQPLSVNCSGGINGVPLLKVNGQDPRGVQIPGLHFGLGNQVQYLTIPAAASANNTNVTCKVFDSDGRIVESYALKIYIQGPLGPPINFSVATADNLTFTLSWVAPFSLPVNKDPPYIYGYALCTNISKYECWNVTNDLNCTFPNTCTYPLNPGISGEELLTPITFSLCAINGAGKGQNATIIAYPKTAEHPLAHPGAALYSTISVSNGTNSTSYGTISVSNGTNSASYSTNSASYSTISVSNGIISVLLIVWICYHVLFV